MESKEELEIIVRQSIKNDLYRIAGYIQGFWGNYILHRFYEDLNRVVNTIRRYPKVYARLDGHPTARKCLINRHTFLYYKVINKKLHILRIYPTRMRPLEQQEIS